MFPAIGLTETDFTVLDEGAIGPQPHPNFIEVSVRLPSVEALGRWRERGRRTEAGGRLAATLLPQSDHAYAPRPASGGTTRGNTNYSGVLATNDGAQLRCLNPRV